MDRLVCERMFLTVMEEGSFVAAAERLGTSSGQASKLVSRLEADLGVRLLNRTTRAVAATEAGQAYYDRLRPLIEEFDNLDLAIRNISRTPRGRLRLSGPLTFGSLELAPALNVFAARYPDIELDVDFTDRIVNLVDEGLDMAIRVGRPADSRLVIRRLCEVPIIVVGAPDYLAAHGEPETPDDLSAHTAIIDLTVREPGRWRFLEPAGERTVTMRGRIRYSNAEACLTAAEAGLGLACLPMFVAADALRAGRVVRLMRRFETTPLPIQAVYPHNRHLAAKVRVLVDFLVERYHDNSPWETVD